MKLFSILPLASLAFALPNGSPPASSCTTFSTEDANFDDLTGSPTLANRIPVPYKSLNWQGFDFVTEVPSNGTVPGPQPHSGNNLAISNEIIQSLQGTASWSAVDYPDSKNKTFSLQSFYYGCVLSLQNGAIALPFACNIAITAFKYGFDTAQAVEVGAQTFTYLPTTSLGTQQQAFGVFSSAFQDISYVMLQYTVADQTYAALQTDLGMNVDSVKYTVCEYGN